MSDLSTLAKKSKNLSILYVEDNRSLNEKVATLLKKLFKEVYVGYDGLEGLKLYKKHTPAIVLTDIKMPKLEGIELVEKIKFLNPQANVIILSAYDEKEYLYKAIELGVFRFLKKPLKIEEFTDVLLALVESMEHQLRVRTLQEYEQSGTLLAIFADEKLKLANESFLGFFGVEDEDEFNKRYQSLDKLFFKHENFLYSSSISWYDKLLHNIQQSHQVYTKNAQGEYKHLVLNASFLEKEAFTKDSDIILAITDITGLNLMPDRQKVNNYEQNSKASLKLLELLKENRSEVDFHSFYKGLTITNSGFIAIVNKDKIGVKTSFNQQKAILKQDKVVISSNLLPDDILCEGVESVDEQSLVTIMKQYRLIDTTPTKRKTIRVQPAHNYKASLTFEAREFLVEAIDDLSIKAVKFSLNALPALFNKGSKIVIVIDFYEKDEIIDSFELEADVLKVWMQNFVYKVVAVYNVNASQEKKLLKYISKRQLELIREFKSL